MNINKIIYTEIDKLIKQAMPTLTNLHTEKMSILNSVGKKIKFKLTKYKGIGRPRNTDFIEIKT